MRSRVQFPGCMCVYIIISPSFITLISLQVTIKTNAAATACRAPMYTVYYVFTVYYVYTVYYDGVHIHTSGEVSTLDCSTTKRVPIPNDRPSKGSGRGVSNADFFGAGTIPTVEISTTENRLGVCVTYAVVRFWGHGL